MEQDTRRALARIENMLRRQHSLLEKIMSGEDDLKAAITANSAAITAATAEMNTLAGQIVAAANGDSDADIEVLAQQLQAQTTQLNLAVTNATNPAPAPVQNTGGAAAPVTPGPTLAPQTPTGTQGATQGTTPNTPADPDVPPVKGPTP